MHLYRLLGSTHSLTNDLPPNYREQLEQQGFLRVEATGNPNRDSEQSTVTGSFIQHGSDNGFTPRPNLDALMRQKQVESMYSSKSHNNVSSNDQKIDGSPNYVCCNLFSPEMMSKQWQKWLKWHGEP